MPRLSVLTNWIVFGLSLAGIGCGSQPAMVSCNPTPRDEAPQLATAFDPTATGAIEGRVVWRGPTPTAAAFESAGLGTPLSLRGIEQLNPGLPSIDEKERGVIRAVVHLRWVDPARSKSWDLQPVRVTLGDYFIRIQQGPVESSYGFVHLGDAVEMLSASAQLELLRGQGAAFFTLPFPQGAKPRSREFHQRGLVELSNGIGRFWARSWMFVSEHPYYCLTDGNGRFRMTEIPDGTYELVCWMPNWQVDRFDRDPELMNVSRVSFKPPMSRSMTVVVRRGEVANIEFQVGQADFR